MWLGGMMDRMSGRVKVLGVAAAVHLSLAAIYGIHVPVELYIPLAIDRPLSIYGGLTGTRSRFDFFAPEVPSQARADFLIVTASGTSRRVRLADTPSAEANRRLGLMYTIYAYPTQRELLLRAWGDYLLRLNPDAVEVVSRIEMLEIPTVQESAAGKTASWSEVGRLTVRRGAEPGR
jgi:hypothetical protein